MEAAFPGFRDFSTLYRLEPGGEPEKLAGGVGPFGFSTTRITNPYDSGGCAKRRLLR